MNRADLVKGVLMWESVARMATERAGELRAQLAADARAELAEQGTAPTWRLQDIATVSLPVSRTAVTVADPAALTAWVAQRHPEEIVPSVRPTFAKVLLARLAADGDTVLDPSTGEVVPGAAVRQGGEPGALRIKANPDAERVAGHFAEQVIRDLGRELGL